MTPPIAPKTGRDLRAAPRVDARFPIELEVDGVEITSQTVDMSATGTAVEYSGGVELGQVFKLSFELPDEGDDIECVGLVRSFRPGTTGRIVGLEFHNLSPAGRSAIARYVRWVGSGAEVEAALHHWTEADPGSAVVAEAFDGITLRWAPGFADTFAQVARHMTESDRLFVPVDGHPLSEGDRFYLEVVPPSCHMVIRTLAEVTWCEDGPTGPGVGVRLAGLTPMDRSLLNSMLGWFDTERDRYR